MALLIGEGKKEPASVVRERKRLRESQRERESERKRKVSREVQRNRGSERERERVRERATPSVHTSPQRFTLCCLSVFCELINTIIACVLPVLSGWPRAVPNCLGHCSCRLPLRGLHILWRVTEEEDNGAGANINCNSLLSRRRIVRSCGRYSVQGDSTN